MEDLTLVPTRCSALQKVTVNNFEAVVHTHKKIKPDKKSMHIDKVENNKVMNNEVDMKKVRYEVFKFGMSGFKAEKKEEVKVALAVKLGARPPKNKCYNYKEYKLIKEKQVKEQLELKKLLAKEKNRTGKPNIKKKRFGNEKRKSKKDGILDPYGKRGKVHISGKVRKR